MEEYTELIKIQHLINERDLSMGHCVMLPEGILHLHTHEPSEIYQIISGTAEFYLDGVSEILTEGDIRYIPSGYSHGIGNVGTDDLKFNWIFPYGPWSNIEYNWI